MAVAIFFGYVGFNVRQRSSVNKYKATWARSCCFVDRTVIIRLILLLRFSADNLPLEYVRFGYGPQVIAAKLVLVIGPPHLLVRDR